MTFELDPLRAYVDRGALRTCEARDQALVSLECGLRVHEAELLAALHEDLGKPAAEAYVSEVGFVLRDIAHARRHLKRWMRGRKVRVPLMTKPGKARSVPEPIGVVLIIGPWNYPLQLLFSPLVAALAAGNAVCLKPSEYTPVTSRVIEKLCRDAFEPSHVRVVTGDASAAQELTALPFDHIFFTGSTGTGRKVAEQAARNLVPTTLELGGKSPCVVCTDANLSVAARRILWGKSLNAGQTCVAPDYVLVEKGVEQELLEAFRTAWAAFYPNGFDRERSSRIVNRWHFDRLAGMMSGGRVVAGGGSDAEALSIEPTVLTEVSRGATIMQEEVFGPLLPVLPVEDFDEALSFVRDRPAPLSAYLFSDDGEKVDAFTRTVKAGTLCVNDTISQILPADLPFGGVGESGWGRYRGHAGFLTLSNRKAVMRRPSKPDPKFRYPHQLPSLNLLRKICRWMLR